MSSNTDAPIATLPAAWLRPLAHGYVIPIWRWLLLPATTFMLKRTGGAWVSGEMRLTETVVSFSQSKLVKASRAPLAEWQIPLDTISEVSLQKGFASETIELVHAGHTTKLMTARSGEFVPRLRQAIQR